MATNTPEVWSDLDHRILTDSHGAVKKVTNIDAVRTSIDNILRTYQGERVMLPSFASRLRDIVFEPITPLLARRVSDEVKRVIETWDDRVTVAAVDFSSDPDRNFVQITIRFVVKGYAETFTHTVNLTAE